MLELLRLLWAAPDFRGKVAWAYVTLIATSTVGGLTPIVLGYSVDAAMAGRWTESLAMPAVNVLWSILHFLRLRADTRGLEGALTAAAERYVKAATAAGTTTGEILSTVGAVDGIVDALRFKLPRAIETTCYAVIGIAGLAWLRWELGVAGVAYLLLVGLLARRFGAQLRILGADALAVRDGLAGAVPAGKAPEVLWRLYGIAVAISDREATASTTQIGIADLLKYGTVVLLAASGCSAGQIMAALAFVRGLDNLADAIIGLAGSAGRVGETVQRLK